MKKMVIMALFVLTIGATSCGTPTTSESTDMDTTVVVTETVPVGLEELLPEDTTDICVN